MPENGTTEETGQSGGLKSLDAALGVLAYMAQQDSSMSLSEIARGCDMPASKVHRYLASFASAGLVRQESRSGHYDLGPEALRLGLAAMARHDFVNLASDGLPDLSKETGMSVLLSIWANDGATVIRWERGVMPTLTSVGLGSRLPLLNSATGRAFLAWAPKRGVQRTCDSEMRRAARHPARAPGLPVSKAEVAELVDEVRIKGYASIDGRLIPGLVAAAAPILDWQNEAQAVVTLVGTNPLTIEPDAPQITALKAFCARQSVLRTEHTSPER